MKYLFIALTISLVLNCNTQSKVDYKEMIRRSHLVFVDAILTEDYDLVSNILADDVTFGTPGGGFGTKQAFVNALKNNTLFYDSAANHIFNVRLYGTVGIANDNVDLIFRYKDKNNDWFRMLEHLTFTSAYIKDKKSIKMIAWQSTRPTTDYAVKVFQ